MFYAIVSGLIGLVICGLLLWFKKRKAAAIAAVAFFGGPVMTYAGLYVRDTINLNNLKKDIAYVQELCEKYGGDKIYKTVDNVEGIFQVKARNPDPEKQWRDQYGMVDPWGLAMGDGAHLKGHIATPYWPKVGYLFLEQINQTLGINKDYVRSSLKRTDQKNHLGRMMLSLEEEATNELRSKYGYYIDDISTNEMRRRWIAGGKIKVIELKTKEVLGERTGFLLGSGKYFQSAWAPKFKCPEKGLMDFLVKVVKPLSEDEFLKSLK
jgi:hypothetical protein